MSGPRNSHIGVVLALVLAGCADATRKPPTVSVRRDSLWLDAGALPLGSTDAKATLLPSGRVFLSRAYFPPTAASFDPASGAWSLLATEPNFVGSNRSQTLLLDGRVLVVGFDIGPQLSATAYDPGSNTWADAGSIPNRSSHTATLLDSGKVLVVGGATVDLFDPITGTSSPAAPMGTSLVRHSATKLVDGRVLVAGGLDPSATSTARLFMPATNTWSPAASLPAPRIDHFAVRLDGGSVLVFGGGTQGSAATESVLYDPVADSWSTVGPLHEPRTDSAAVLLSSGQVLVVGGFSGYAKVSAELFDPLTKTWSFANPLTHPRSRHTAVALLDGRALLIGGQEDPRSSEIFDPALGITCVTPADCSPSQPHCVNGLCCTRACNGGCESCDQPGRSGICTSFPFGHPGAPQCLPYFCTGSVLCPAACQNDSFCAANFYCANAQCVSFGSGVAGTGCRLDAHCASNHCVDGVCCDSACDGPCEACDEAGRIGTCSGLGSSIVEVACGGFRCGLDAGCSAQCAATSDCSPLHRCVDAGCVAREPQAGNCGIDSDCLFNRCVAGHCCGPSCASGCTTCSAPDYSCKALPNGAEDPTCAPYRCQGVAFCTAFCTATNQCQDGFTCNPLFRCLAADAGLTGSACGNDAECLTGFCIDRVCCNNACGSNNNDCQVCNVDAGALTNGLCGPRRAGEICRPAATDAGCEAIEVCDGIAGTCPADNNAPAGTVCRPAVDLCDLDDVCDGTEKECPSADLLASPAVACRPSTGTCDPAEHCTGKDAGCPPDVLLKQYSVCRPSASMDVCDPEEICSGDAGACPADIRLANGTGCGIRLVCQEGACLPEPPVPDAGTMVGPKNQCGCGSAGGYFFPLLVALFLARRR